MVDKLAKATKDTFAGATDAVYQRLADGHGIELEATPPAKAHVRGVKNIEELETIVQFVETLGAEDD